MDQDVNNLLDSWGLSEYKEKFAANNIDLNSLGLLTGDMMKELIGPIGDRARFMKNINNWNILTNSLQNPNDDDDVGVDVLNDKHKASKIADLYAPTTSKAGLEATSPSSSISITSTIDLSDQQYNNSMFEIIDVDNNIINFNTPLKELLQRSLEGRGLLSLHSESGLLTNTGRRKICNIIIRNLLETNPDKRIPSSTLLQYAQEIKTIFEKENISTYFVPYVNSSKLKIRRCAKGKLYDCLQNRKREYRESLQIKFKKSTEDSVKSKSPVQNSDIIEDVMWLKNSCDPWSSVEEKWKITSEYRRGELNNSHLSIQKYMDAYPALKKPAGFHLLMLDFKSQYPDSENNLIENFPLHKNKILDVTVQKYSRHPDHNLRAFTEEYINFKKEDAVTALSQEITSIYAFMFLPLLLGNPVAKNTKKSWRPSKQESREAFITHIKAATELQETISRRKEKYASHGLTFQPTIFIVGPTLSEIQNYYIVINDTLYTVHSIVEAVDVTFKLYYALNCEYPATCISVYYFLQKGFFKISTKWDKEYVSVNALLADLNMQ